MDYVLARLSGVDCATMCPLRSMSTIANPLATKSLSLGRGNGEPTSIDVAVEAIPERLPRAAIPAHLFAGPAQFAARLMGDRNLTRINKGLACKVLAHEWLGCASMVYVALKSTLAAALQSARQPISLRQKPSGQSMSPMAS